MKHRSCLWILWGAFSVIKTCAAQTENISVTEGRRQSFTCKESQPVSWFGPSHSGSGQQIRYTNEGDTEILTTVSQKDRLRVTESNNSVSTLTIVAVLKSDSGNYTCSRMMFQLSFILTVKDPDATLITTEGSEAVMPCPHSITINNLRWKGPPNDVAYNYRGTINLNNRDLSAEFRARLSLDGKSGALKINDTRLMDENIYICDNISVETTTKLIVLVTPDPPKFTNKLENRNGSDQMVVRAKEDEHFTLICQANRGKPQPIVRWLKGGTDEKEIAGNNVATLNTDGTFNVTSTVNLTAVRSEDRVIYVCQTSHITWMSVRNVSVELYLYLKPSVPVMSNPGDIQENASLFITCTVYGCRPSANIMWNGSVTQPPSIYTEDRATETFNVSSTYSKKVTRQDNGETLVCAVTHTALTSSLVSLRNLTVWFSPTNVSISNNKRVTAGDTLTLTCTTSVSNPAAIIIWNNKTLPLSGGPDVDQDGQYGGKIRHQNLTITLNRYMDENVITCTADNERISGNVVTDTSILDVRFSPIVSVSVDPNTLVTEGDKDVKLKCTAWSKPTSRFKWMKENVSISQVEGSVENVFGYIITTVSRTHAGHYSCLADNGISGPQLEQQKDIELLVQYPPDIKISASNVTTKDPNATLLCSPYGYPDKYMFGVWLHSWPGVNKTLRTLNSSSTDKTATLVLHNLTYEDSGIYTCQASNGIKAKQSDQNMMTNSVHLLVKSAPTILYIPSVFGGGTGRDVMVQFNFYANTEDNLTVLAQHFNSSKPSHQGTFEPIQLHDLPIKSSMVPAPGFSARVMIRITSTEDFGQYSITVTNIIGSDVRSVNITPASEPEKPTNFSSLSVGVYEVTFSWIPGFHGGFNQTFVIQFSLDNNTWYSASIIDGGQRKDQLDFTVTGLSPNTRYFFRIFSYNIVGNGTYADNLLTVDTLEVTRVPQTIDGPNAAAIGGGVGSAVMVVTGIAVVLIILKRRSHSQKQSSGLVDNPVYDSSDPVPCQSASNNGAGATYAVVAKQKKMAAQSESHSKLYAQIVRSTKKRRNEETYENAVLGQNSLNAADRADVYKNSGDVSSDKNVYEDPRTAMSKDPQVSQDGFLYADLKLDPPRTKNGKMVIRGIENRTEYAEIAYNKRGEPLPDSDSEKEKDANEKNTK